MNTKVFIYKIIYVKSLSKKLTTFKVLVLDKLSVDFFDKMLVSKYI